MDPPPICKCGKEMVPDHRDPSGWECRPECKERLYPPYLTEEEKVRAQLFDRIVVEEKKAA